MKLASAPLLVALVASAPSSAQSSKPTELRFADVPWHLALALGDMKPAEGFPSRPDRDVFTYSDGKGTILSVIVENAHAPATLASCREVFERRKLGNPGEGILLVNEVQGQRGDAATQEYDLKIDSHGEAIVQHNVFSCRVRGNYYIDAHASKIRYRPGDRNALMALIDGVTIVE